MTQKWFFEENFFFCKNSRLKLQFGIFTLVVPPLLLPREFFESLMYTFKDIKTAPKKDTTHISIAKDFESYITKEL